MAGCLYKSVYYPVGKFYDGCESSCECLASGEVKCSDRCELPYHPRGGFADDPLCVERTVDEEKCCVLVTCASAVEDDEDSPCQGVVCGPNAECKHEVLREELAETICVCREGYKGDPDSAKGCSEAPSNEDEETSPTPPACLANNNTYYSRGESWFDGCDYKCTCSQSLEILCQPRCKILPENIDSECELRPDPLDSCCKVMACSDKSNTTTVVQPSLPSDGCVFKNTTYKQGERFYDGCIQHCQCMGFGDLVCLARCPPTNPEVGENCVTLPDLTDSCCSVTVCDKIEENEDVEKIPEITTNLPEIVPTTSADETDISVEEKTTQSSQTTTLVNSEVTTLAPEVETTTTQDAVDNDDNDVTTMLVLEVESSSTETAPPSRSKTPRILNNPEKILLGDFTTKWHGVKGTVYAVNETTLLIKNFSYDGAGPDAFFYVGGSAKPIQDGVIIPYPAGAEGEGGDPPVLGRFDNQDVYLNLPSTININNLRWISVWCRAFSANFGELIWGDKLAAAAVSQQPSEAAVHFPTNAAADNDPSTAAEDDIAVEDPTAAENEIQDHSDNKNEGAAGCEMGGEVYGVGQQFYDNCDRFCVCQEGFETLCFDIECPSSFGQDVLSPNCVLWDNHDDFVPKAPACCPPVPTCISTGQCQYGNTTIENYQNVPMELSGCEQRCHCQDSEIHCEEACYKLSETAPRWLNCDASRAGLVPNKDRPCCNMWDCLPAPLDTCTDLPANLKDVSLRPFNATALLVEFVLPPAILKHKAHFNIKYSAAVGGLRDHSQWPAEIHPVAADGVIAAAQLTQALTGLSPNTEYFVRPSLVLEDCGGEEEVRELQADILTARTLTVGPSVDPGIPLVVYLNMSLAADQVTSSTARVSWRHFDGEEKALIDGLQLRYLILKQDTPVSQVPLTSPFIHRDTNYFVFENLTPATTYEVDLDIIPVPGSKTDLYSGLKLEFTTLPFTDIYDFNINIQVTEVESNSVEVSWAGVPSPDQKFVNIYRVIYHANSENHVRDEASVFKISKIDSPKRMYITDLQSDLDYQIWLEAYLTNGKMKKSNVAEFRTRPAEVVRGAEPNVNPKPVDDYYQSMVAVAIIATFAIVAFLIVLYFYLRRNVTYTHTINKERPATSDQSYLNSGFKESSSAAGQSLEMAGTQNGVGKHNP